MAEQWRDIAGYDGIYQVSDQGQVRNTQTSKIMQPVKMKNGRLYDGNTLDETYPRPRKMDPVLGTPERPKTSAGIR